MRQQRINLLAQLREAARSDDITSRLAVNRDRSSAEMESLFDTELAKHRPQVALIEQNLSAQQNILHALTDCYAKLSGCRRTIVEAFRKRDTIISALIASYDAYEDLLAKVNKGIDFYQKLETNVNKLLQRLRSTCRVQEEEREQKNASITNPPTPQTPVQTPVVSTTTPKLRDYLQQPVGIRPAPLGSEHTDLTKNIDLRNPLYAQQFQNLPNGTQHYQYQLPRVSTPHVSYPHPNISAYQVPTTAYPTSTFQNLPPTSFEMSVSKPQSFQNPQVTPAMPQYQVAPSQYPNVSNPQYQNYTQPIPGTQFLTSHASKVTQNYPPVPQSPTLPQGYPNSPQNYPNYPQEQPNMTQQQPVHSVQKPDSSQKMFTPPTVQNNISGSYQNPASPIIQNRVSTPQNNITSNAISQGVTQFPIGQYSGGTVLGQYPNSGVGYSNPKSGYPSQIPANNYQNPGPTNQFSTVSQNQQIGANPGQYQVNPVGQNSNLGTNSGQFQNYANSHYPITSTPGGQKEADWYSAPQGTTSGYQNVGTTCPAGSSGAQYPNSVGQYQPYQVPTSSISPQHVLNSSQNIVNRQNVSSTSNQIGQMRPPSPYYQPGYQSGSQTGQYTQDPKNIYPQYQNVGYPTQNQTLGYQYSNSHGTNNYYQPVPQGGQGPQSGQVSLAPQFPQSGQIPQPAQFPHSAQAPLSGTNYPAQVPQNNPKPSISTAKKNSNIDLLAGLDFNVNQAPLDPVKAPLDLKSMDEKKFSSEEEISSTDKQNLEDRPTGTNINQDPDRWKKEQTFEKDVNNLDHWVTHLMEQELESRWKVLQKENDNSRVVISVARCYPGRNRCPDSLPYDRNRYELPCPPASDDYINASKVQIKNLPPIIMTQAPLATTIQQFWTMVANSGAEIVVCLMTDSELQSCGLGEGYWRTDYGAHLRSTQVGPFWTERILAVAGKDISHLQLTTSWPTIGSGDIITGLADLAFEVNRKKRDSIPIVIHCLTGIGRSGAFSVLLKIASELLPNIGPPILIDPLEIAMRLSEYRRNPIRDRLHLEFTYRAVLKMARTILPAPVLEQIFPEKVPETQNFETKDPLSDLDPLWKLKINDD